MEERYDIEGFMLEWESAVRDHLMSLTRAPYETEHLQAFQNHAKLASTLTGILSRRG